ncbi:hypothetical protein ERO13_A05G334375v2 [Gossypium hirsutum]|uniref:Uncharacterized protein n=2 Tax=Gossypium mustelinum TaxID=34275 RepID=A0A5D2ZFC0_GOSMU|nr:hypothetical protein ERO13_A05G334375v2 [Gossypium hirsutum]TYJ37252.1 hypothetical protein E1A91_A05G363400v1 [Gossypium mustelinum]
MSLIFYSFYTVVSSTKSTSSLGELRHIMDIDSLMLDFQGNKDIGTPEQGVGGSGCKRQQMKEKFVNTEHSSSTNRIHHRKGKEIIVYGGDILVSSTPTALMTLMASVCRSLFTGPNFGIIHNVPHVSLLGSLQLTSLDGEVNAFFPWKDHLGVRRYPFCPYVVRKRWEEHLPQYCVNMCKCTWLYK